MRRIVFVTFEQAQPPAAAEIDGARLDFIAGRGGFGHGAILHLAFGGIK